MALCHTVLTCIYVCKSTCIFEFVYVLALRCRSHMCVYTCQHIVAFIHTYTQCVHLYMYSTYVCIYVYLHVDIVHGFMCTYILVLCMNTYLYTMYTFTAHMYVYAHIYIYSTYVCIHMPTRCAWIHTIHNVLICI